MPTKSVFQPVPTELDFPYYEAEILRLWQERKIFEKSQQETPEGAPSFVFYEGPPTANGVPHNGHVLTRVMKDLFPRYKSMRGFRVLRKAGWDTHGLPVEVEVEKELRIHGKAAIEAYGVEPFVSRCINSVFRYTSDWEHLTERIGFWVNMPEAYVTFHRSYVESEWWALAQLYKKGLLYQGHKVVWWWAQGGTALSSAEVGLGYKTVDDPSLFVAFPLLDDPSTALVVWTTTPWTLPSNWYAAVRGDCEYQYVTVGDPLQTETKVSSKIKEAKRESKQRPAFDASTLIVAAPLREALSQKLGFALDVVRSVKGTDLVGLRYQPPFDIYFERLGQTELALKEGGTESFGWRVIAEDFVTLDTGTGIVHIAPAFGEDDHRAHQKQLRRYQQPDTVELLCAVNPDGTFKPEMGSSYAGRWVKEADRDIIKELQQKQLLILQEQVRHDYPYCWRADDDPLIQLARPAWYIRTTARIDQAIANNQNVRWFPEHIKNGRFGDLLANNVDWALSRERYWGTPLNIWVCSANGEHKHAPASVAEIEALNPEAFFAWKSAKLANPELSEHLMVHKPWIDAVTFSCPTCGSLMHRVPEVIDCWFDSGCMPFAQWGFPHAEGSRARFDQAFPASFISEAIDQTRGWFYSLLMISTLVFDEDTQRDLGLAKLRQFPHPFETCIVLGHVCDRDGKKESKSKGNYTPPDIILDRVKMDFGVVVDVSAAKPSVNPPVATQGVALIAPEDLDGMDVSEGATVRVYRPDHSEKTLELVVRCAKNLPRRVVLLSELDRKYLDVSEAANGLATMPVEVPRLLGNERVTLEDPTRPAPGADAFRWFFYASSPPWSNTRHSLKNVRMLQKDFLVKLRNVYSFFTIYANIDGWDPKLPEHQGRTPSERPLLDRWLLSELQLTIRDVRAALDNFLAFDAATRLVDIVEGLSNWYVRRSRERFWGPGLPEDKLDAYSTLYEALTTIALLIAPFVPFFADEMYQNLVVGANVPGAKLSVHLAPYPEAKPLLIDESLAREMRAVRDIVSLGLSVRAANKLPVMQPLTQADVVFNDPSLMEAVRAHLDLIEEELNVKNVRLMTQTHETGAVTFRIKANFRALGPRLGKNVQVVKQALEKADGGALFAELAENGYCEVQVNSESVKLDRTEVEVVVEAQPGFAAETGRVGVVVLHTTLTESLIDDGLLRRLVRRVQESRKKNLAKYTDRISLTLNLREGSRLRGIVERNARQIEETCLVQPGQVLFGEVSEDVATIEIGDESLRFSWRVID
jgi:isoleucyl-tRNA synthetase